MGKYGHFQRSVNLLTPMGLFQFICSVDFRQLVIFKKNRFGEIVNSGSQSNPKVQSTLMSIINTTNYEFKNSKIGLLEQLIIERQP